MQKVGRLLNRYSEEVEVSDAINTLFEKKIIEYNEEKNTLTVNMDIKLKWILMLVLCYYFSWKYVISMNFVGFMLSKIT